MVCYGFIWFGLVCFGMVWYGLVWGGGGCQMTSEFIHGEISMLLNIIDYLQFDHSISTTILV